MWKKQPTTKFQEKSENYEMNCSAKSSEWNKMRIWERERKKTISSTIIKSEPTRQLHMHRAQITQWCHEIAIKCMNRVCKVQANPIDLLCV